jgi:Rieske Fe-S protein
MSRNTEVMHQTEQSDIPLAPAGTSRRSVLGAAVAVGAVGVLAACGGGEAETPAASTSAASSGPSTPASSPPGGGGEALTSTADVPVGSGVIIADEKVVVTQPKAGEFKAFSSTCTHMSCQVSSISGDSIACPCHGSSYSIVDGSVQGGPAPRPLPKVAIKVEGDEVVRA